jgi:hypothetical protein
MPRADEVDLGKGYNPWGLQRKLQPNDTQGLVAEEVTMLRFVQEHQPVKLWVLLNHMGKAAGPHKYQTRSERLKLIPLSTRLCREGKLKRVRANNTLIIGPNNVLLRPDISESPDFSGALRDVPGLGSLVA